MTSSPWVAVAAAAHMLAEVVVAEESAIFRIKLFRQAHRWPFRWVQGVSERLHRTEALLERRRPLAGVRHSEQSARRVGAEVLPGTLIPQDPAAREVGQPLGIQLVVAMTLSPHLRKGMTGARHRIRAGPHTQRAVAAELVSRVSSSRA